MWCGWGPVDNFDLPALAAFNSAFPYELAHLVDSSTAVSDIIDTLLTGLPAVYSLADNKFYLKEIIAPTGPAALILTPTEVFPSLQGEKNNENYYRGVSLKYDRNFNVTENVGGVTQERLEWLAREYRVYSRRNLDLIGVKECFDLGPLDTCRVDRDDAADLADRLLARFGARLETR